MRDDERALILLVASPDENRDLLARTLRHELLDVQCAGSASECIQLVRRAAPTVIVMDRLLPDGDGWELVRVLKTLSSTRAAPVIAIADDDSRRLIERAFIVGCDAFLVKPFEPDALVHQIRRLLASSANGSPR